MSVEHETKTGRRKMPKGVFVERPTESAADERALAAIGGRSANNLVRDAVQEAISEHAMFEDYSNAQLRMVRFVLIMFGRRDEDDLRQLITQALSEKSQAAYKSPKTRLSVAHIIEAVENEAIRLTQGNTKPYRRMLDSQRSRLKCNSEYLLDQADSDAAAALVALDGYDNMHQLTTAREASDSAGGSASSSSDAFTETRYSNLRVAAKTFPGIAKLELDPTCVLDRRESLRVGLIRVPHTGEVELLAWADEKKGKMMYGTIKAALRTVSADLEAHQEQVKTAAQEVKQ